jgi:hypothetical protein
MRKKMLNIFYAGVKKAGYVTGRVCAGIYRNRRNDPSGMRLYNLPSEVR